MTHHGIIHAQSQFDGLTPSERAMSQEMDERDRIIMELRASEARLLKELEAAFGYLMNAKIDLETAAPKRTALMTVSGGVKRARAAIAAAKGTAS